MWKVVNIKKWSHTFTIGLFTLSGLLNYHVATGTGKSAAMGETQVLSLGWEDPLEKEMATHLSILPGRAHGRRSLADYSPWGCKELHTTEWLHLNLQKGNFKVKADGLILFLCEDLQYQKCNIRKVVGSQTHNNTDFLWPFRKQL